MRKIIGIILISFFSVSVLKAQDVIIKNDKTELKTRVVEISDIEIKYKKFDMLDGPSYTIKKSEVFMIVYQNGQKETFKPEANTNSAYRSSNHNLKLTVLKKGSHNFDYYKNSNINFKYNGGSEKVKGSITSIQPDYIVMSNGKQYEINKITSVKLGSWGKTLLFYGGIAGVAAGIGSNPILAGAGAGVLVISFLIPANAEIGTKWTLKATETVL
jgi:hypothetical protein